MNGLPSGEKFYEDYYREHPFDELGVVLTAVAMGIIAALLLGGLAISVLTRKNPANFEVRD